MVSNKEKIMASAYHIVMCEDVTAPTGVSTFTAQATKTLPSSATDFILVCTSENADVSVRLEHSADNTNFAEVKDVDKIVEHVCSNIRTNDQIIIMSNGAFGGIHKKIAERLN